jgi:hypothetical protein
MKTLVLYLAAALLATLILGRHVEVPFGSKPTSSSLTTLRNDDTNPAELNTSSISGSTPVSAPDIVQVAGWDPNKIATDAS